MSGNDNLAQRIINSRIDIVNTNRWLKSDGMKAETEGLIIAAKNESLPIRDGFGIRLLT